VVQETFERAHRYQAGWRGEGTPLLWLFRIAERRYFTLLHKRGREPLSPVDLDTLVDEDGATDASASPFAPEVRLQRERLVRTLLASADDDTRALLVHRFLDGCELTDVATRLDISERTVRRRLERFFARARRLATGG
jgi:RNA polymerase sigma factor (sigma-70 family)